MNNKDSGMQLKIDRTEEKRGLIFKKLEYRVSTQLLCSEEEQRAIEMLDMKDKTIVENYTHDGISTWGNRPISSWMKGISFPCSEIGVAIDIEEQVSSAAKIINENVLQFLESGGEVESSRVIDL